MFSQQFIINTHLNTTNDSDAKIYRGIKGNARRMSNLNFNHNPAAVTLVQQLGAYLNQRIDEYRFIFFQGMGTVMERSNFMVTLVKSIESNNVSEQLKLLEERNIKRFKGFFSQRLYDILVDYRNKLIVNPSQKNTQCRF